MNHPLSHQIIGWLLDQRSDEFVSFIHILSEESPLSTQWVIALCQKGRHREAMRRVLDDFPFAFRGKALILTKSLHCSLGPGKAALMEPLLIGKEASITAKQSGTLLRPLAVPRPFHTKELAQPELISHYQPTAFFLWTVPSYIQAAVGPVSVLQHSLGMLHCSLESPINDSGRGVSGSVLDVVEHCLSLDLGDSSTRLHVSQSLEKVETTLRSLKLQTSLDREFLCLGLTALLWLRSFLHSQSSVRTLRLHTLEKSSLESLFVAALRRAATAG